MNRVNQYLIFKIDEQGFVIPLDKVNYVIQMIEVKPVPQAPEFILGVINYFDAILPVINMRKIFAMPDREIELTDRILIIDTSSKRISLWVDEVGDILEIPVSEIKGSESIYLNLNFLEGIFQYKNELILIQNVDNLFDEKQMIKLQKAILNKKKNVIKMEKKNKPKEDSLQANNLLRNKKNLKSLKTPKTAKN